jgi:hypothetical protein
VSTRLTKNDATLCTDARSLDFPLVAGHLR